MKMEVVNIGELDYDGSQLHHAFAYEQKGVLGPSICYFLGSADVNEHLVDLEDSLEDDFIFSEYMMHFIIEIPNIGIQEAVLWQRLFIRLIAEHFTNLVGDEFTIEVDGDDIMIDEEYKFSVSIATLSRFGGLIHVGLNIRAGEECPVSAFSLYDFRHNYTLMPDSKIAESLANIFAQEFEDIVNATYKVIEV